MIAPLRETDYPATRTRKSLHGARRIVASTLLEHREPSPGEASRVPTWQAWLFTAWVVTAVVVCFATLFGP